MNKILSDPTVWEHSARGLAERRFHPRIVEAFYADLIPESDDSFAVRDSAISLPSSATSEYRRVLLLGTTGGGKTTLIRQLIGADPRHDRFPATSTAKTTVADMELVLADGPFRAVVTFQPRGLVREYVEECVSAAVLASYRSESDSEVLRRLLTHVSQRFRLDYILGNPELKESEGEEVEAEEAEEEETGETEESFIDLAQTALVLDKARKQARDLAKELGEDLRKELEATSDDERVLEEIFEENFDSLLREDERFGEIVDDLLDEIERRFDLLREGRPDKTKQGWLRSWQWETPNRADIIRAVRRFSSNYVRYWGTLLTPIVSGIRVAGPFMPSWRTTMPLLVLQDGEGLGHTPDSAASLPPEVTRRFDDGDAILLVDNGAQPMQAAAVAVMRNLATEGKTSKLLLCFTHLDMVVGDNLPTFHSRQVHVKASAENALVTIGEQLGPMAERALRKRLEHGSFYVGGIQGTLHLHSKRDRRYIDQLEALIGAVDNIIKRPEPVIPRPVFDRTTLVLAIKDAAEKFHTGWRARLGFEFRAGVSKEHWTRVKALSRRLAQGWAEGYDNLQPIADLHRELKEKIYVFLQSPLEWTGSPTEDEKQAVLEEFANGVSRRILDIASQRLRTEHVVDWQQAYNKSGMGSTFARATIIQGDIYEKAAPIPDIAASLEGNRFVHQITAVVKETAEECKIELR